MTKYFFFFVDDESANRRLATRMITDKRVANLLKDSLFIEDSGGAALQSYQAVVNQLELEGEDYKIFMVSDFDMGPGLDGCQLFAHINSFNRINPVRS